MNSSQETVKEIEDGPSSAALALIDSQQRLAAIDKELGFRQMKIMTEGMRGELAKINETLALIVRLLADRN